MKSSPYLEYIKVQNFKSFKEIDLKLNQFNVIIGANASGKSNFVQIFNFIKNIREQGLDNAISLQGGIEYLRNFKLGQEQNLVIELKIVLPHKTRIRMPFRRNKDVLYYTGATWEFELYLGKRSGFKIIRDIWKIDIVASKRDEKETLNQDTTGTIEITTKNGKIHHDIIMQDKSFTQKDLGIYWHTEQIPTKKMILELRYALDYLFPELPNFFDELMVYDFDPKLAKKTAQLTGKFELEHDGSNLPIIVKNIISNKEHKRKFFNLITDVFPSVKSIYTENFADKSILLTMTENYSKKHSLSSTLITDGTINITALIISLYFQNNSFTIIESPERNIHPSLISKVITMMNEVTPLRQIMITTHNPEIVRYAGLENLFAVRRNSDGYSEIMRSSEQEGIKIFLENKMELKELYVQNILGS